MPISVILLIKKSKLPVICVTNEEKYYLSKTELGNAKNRSRCIIDCGFCNRKVKIPIGELTGKNMIWYPKPQGGGKIVITGE